MTHLFTSHIVLFHLFVTSHRYTYTLTSAPLGVYLLTYACAYAYD